jgi:TrmH family RNA methyltransferase
VVSDVKINEFIAAAAGNSLILFALAADGAQSFNAAFVAKIPSAPTAWIFGNEARGLPDLPSEITTVAIPMKGYAESLNVASAAAIVLHSVGLSL